MLAQIPTHLIGGPLGAGKTSLIRALLAQKPADERWAVLINEFGQIGLDAALLEGAADGVQLAEIAGGCLCCVNGAPFQVGLARLLRQTRPDRLLIEPSGLGHPLDLLRQLGQAPWQTALAVQPLVLVLDAGALAAGAPLAESQARALPHAGLLVLNKSETLDEPARARLRKQLPAIPCYWTSEGRLPLAELPGSDARPSTAEAPALPTSGASLTSVWRDPREPICLSQQAEAGWSIGWRWHPSQRFDLEAVAAWLAGLPWRRAKLVLHGRDGWRSANALEGAPLAFRPSEWRKDSRLELIFATAQPEPALKAGMARCRLDD